MNTGFIGNEKAYSTLINWLKKPIEGTILGYNNVCVIIGSSGIGKTYGINKAVSDCKLELCTNEFLNFKDFKDYFLKLINLDIVSQFDGKTLKQKVLFIDDVDMLLIFDRTFMNNLQTFVESKSFPAIKVILASDRIESKSMNKFIKSCLYLELYVPSYQSIYAFLYNTFPEVDLNNIIKIVENSKGNISSIMHLIESEMKSNDKIDDSPKIGDLYQSLELQKIRFLFEEDQWLHPLRYHENLIYELENREGLNKEYFYLEQIRNLCYWDMMMVHCKGGSLSIPHEFISRSAVLLNGYKVIKEKENKNCFTRMFNYLSLRKKNMITLYNSDFPWYEIGNLHKNIVDKSSKKRTSKKFST